MDPSPPDDPPVAVTSPSADPKADGAAPTPEVAPAMERRRRSRRSHRRSSVARPSATDEHEDEAETETDSDSAEQLTTASSWVSWAMAVTVVATLLCAGGTSYLGRAVATALIGLLMIIAPLQRRIPWLVTLCLLALAVVPLIGLLPAAWLGPLPEWRETLISTWGLALPHTVSPQPGVTLESWMLLAAGLGWFWFCLGRQYSTNDRRAILQVATFGGLLVCALTIAQSRGLITLPFWPEKSPHPPALAGPFPNRNIVSSLAALIAVLCAACAYDAYRQKSRLWLVFGLAILIPTGVIVTNTSRGGVVLLILGLAVWLGTASMRRGFFKKIALAGSMGLVVVTIVLFYGGNLVERIETQADPALILKDSRFDIYGETLSMIATEPWIGVGLGNFAEVFTLHNHIDQLTSVMIHPESDWFWLLAEGGLLMGIPAALLLFWLSTSTGPWLGGRDDSRRRRQDRRLRNAAGLCFFLGILHGIVDIPNHNVGYVMLSLLFAGIAIRPKKIHAPVGLLPRIAARLAGVAILASSVGWAALVMNRPLMPGHLSSTVLRNQAQDLANLQRDQEALTTINEAILREPMNGMSYFLRAQIRLRLGQPSASALADFARARALYPRFRQICLDEGQVWLRYDPALAIVPWRETLTRDPLGALGDYGTFTHMLGHAARHPALISDLWSLATTPSMKVVFLWSSPPGPAWENALSALLLQQPKLDGISPPERARLFETWRQRGDRDQLLAALEKNTAWQQDAWRILAAEYASRSKFKEAWDVIAKYATRVQVPTVSPTVDVEALERTAIFNPTDPIRQIDLFFALRATERYVEARRTMEKTLTLPTTPAYLKLELADVYALQGDYRRAWETAKEYLQIP